jgi:glycosyltransferase involved in cell wall biosynthesis
MQRGIAPLADLRSLLALLQLLQRVRPVITDFSTPKAGLLGNLAAWMLRVPHRVYTLRGLKMESVRGLKRAVLLCCERLSARCAHVVLCNSESLRIRGVDTERFAPGSSSIRSDMGIPAREIVLGFVGRLTTDKGLPELLEAFETILRAEPAAWLLLVGWFDAAEDALDPRWRSWIGKHPRIRHTGYVEDTAPYYRAMDLLILPTHREGFPNVALEAAASGLAVITTESTGARDAVLAEVTGLLIPAGNPEAIAESALSLIRNGEKRRSMGAAGRAWVVEKFSNERVLGLAVEFYRGLARELPAKGSE